MNIEDEFLCAANQREPKRDPQSVLKEQFAPKTMPNKVMSATETRQGPPKTPPQTTQQPQTTTGKPTK
jgi:hypothetical protein